MTTTLLEMSADGALLAKIKKQVEFYFGDGNYARDKFLQAEAAKNADGWIKLDVIASFNRLKTMGATIERIQEAVKDSPIVELSGDGTDIKRKLPVQDVQDLLTRSIYVKGFPKDTPLEQLEDFFGAHPGLLAIRMRRFREEKSFKGSVFVEFASIEHAMEAIEKLKSTKFAECPLIVMPKADYLESKTQEFNSKKTVTKADEHIASNYIRGCLVRVQDVPETVEHVHIKKAFQELDFPVAYFERIPDTAGAAYIRLKERQVSDFLDKHDYVDISPEVRLSTFRPATDEEEELYYKNLATVWRDKGKHHGHGRKFNSGKKRNDRKRSADDGDFSKKADEKQARLDVDN
jgi:lupus La protein